MRYVSGVMLMVMLAVMSHGASAGAGGAGNGGGFAGTAAWWKTAKLTGDRLTPKTPLVFVADNGTLPAGATLVQVLPTDKFQTILGFGGAFTQATAIAISKMTPALQNEMLAAYFGPNGIGYSIGRLAINSCDFSVGNYSYDDVADDFSLAKFALAQPDLTQIIPLVKRALNWTRERDAAAAKDTSPNGPGLRLFGTPWSPPAWLKVNKKMDGSTSPVGLRPEPQYQRVWAQYLSRFIDEYEKLGVPIWGITIQNEVNSLVGWESCNMTPDFQRDFIKAHLGPVMNASHPDVKIMIYDDQKTASLVSFVQTIMLDPVASQYVHGTGVHWYAGDGWAEVDRAHSLAPNKFLMATEACEGYLPWSQGPKLGDWSRGEHYGHDILGDLSHNFVAWTDWNLVLDQQGGINHLNNFCDALIIADNSKQVLHYQIPYFYMGHFSKFIPRGSVRIGAFVSDSIESVAFLLPASSSSSSASPAVAVVLMNSQSYDVQVKVTDRGQATFLTLDSHSIVTLVYTL